MFNIRTDLATEAHKIAKEQGELEGVTSEELSIKDINITRVNVLNEMGADKIGKPIGLYVTLDIKDTSSDSERFNDTVDIVAHEIKSICRLNEGDTVLIAGLGNIKITPDALGPKSTENVMVTRHLKENAPDFFNTSGLRQVSAISPGVLGQTGVETAEILKGVIERTKPNLLIVIDALASRKMKRLATTIQICDSGITPGGGVGNSRNEISENTMGVRVVSVGVPTVVDAATLSSDVIDEVLKFAKQNASSDVIKLFENYSENEKYELIKESLTPYDLNLVVTPKDIDFIIGEISKVLGFSLNKALHENITVLDMDAFLA